jgi:hypothetical protein
MVVRTFPIRVAGNSGPLPCEISWYNLAYDINAARSAYSLPPIVSPVTLEAFKDVCYGVADVWRDRGDLPAGCDGLNLHQIADRGRYQVALSEFYKEVLSGMAASEVADLQHLFEMTTVTKKLRRVAQLNLNSLDTAARQIRPHRLAVTFMNYQFPQRWYDSTDQPPIGEGESLYLRRIANVVDCDPSLVSYGPGPEHIVDLRG